MSSSPYRIPSDPRPKPGRFPRALFVGIVSAIAVSAGVMGCPPGVTPQTVINDITPAGACIAQQLLSGGVSDPLQIVTACAGTTIDDVIQVIEQLLAQQPDGGTMVAKLQELHTKALAAKAAGAGGPHK